MTNEVTDKRQLANVALQARENLQIEKAEVLADAGYYAAAEVKQCVAENLTPYIPTSDTSANTKLGLFGKTRFTYDAAKSVYLGPAHQELTYRFRRQEKGRWLSYYRTAACGTCPLKKQCTRNQANQTKYVRRACRNKIGITDLDAIFCDEIKDYSLSPDAIADYLKSSDETFTEKNRLIGVQREELQRVQKEMQRTYDLYQQEKLDAEGFSRFYTPIEERRKQIEASLPRLEAELDILKVNALSAEEIAVQAGSLYDHWQTMPSEEKRQVVELIADRIVVWKDEITIKLCYAPTSKDMAKGWRKGSFLIAFCHLVIRAVRPDSPPFEIAGQALCQAIVQERVRRNLSQTTAAIQLGVSLSTLGNWECGRTKPTRKVWSKLHSFFNRELQVGTGP